MDDDLKMVLVICSFLLAAVALPVGCTVQNQSLKAEAIRNGASPIEADCAFGGGERVMCAVLAAGKKPKEQ